MDTFTAIAERMLKIPASSIRDDLSPKDVPHWDSMNYLLFIAELEKEFDMSFTMDEVMDAASIGDIRKIVEARKKK
jgi:acyl carrier protein